VVSTADTTNHFSPQARLSLIWAVAAQCLGRHQDGLSKLNSYAVEHEVALAGDVRVATYGLPPCIIEIDDVSLPALERTNRLSILFIPL